MLRRCFDFLIMKRQHTMRPDFVVDNQREVNEDPGTKTFIEKVEDPTVLNFGGTNTTYASRSADETDFEISSLATDTDHPFTIAFWINLNVASDSTYRFIWNSWYPLHVWYRNETLGISMRDEDVGESNQFITTQVGGKEFFEDEEGNWMHVVLAYTPETADNNNTEKVQFYKNGSTWGSAVVSPNDAYTNLGRLDSTQRLGNVSSDNAQHIKAKLSNFLFYNHSSAELVGVGTTGGSAFTDADVTNIYNGGRVHQNYRSLAKGTDLVGYYKCDDDPAGGQIKDYSGLDNHFTTVNGSITRVASSGLKSLIRHDLPWAQKRMTVPGLFSLRTNPQQ